MSSLLSKTATTDKAYNTDIHDSLSIFVLLPAALLRWAYSDLYHPIEKACSSSTPDFVAAPLLNRIGIVPDSSGAQ